MQFVRNGPDVPERLLQAHEDGHLVLFCGAGVSGPAGLPGFATLVEQVFLAFPPDPVQQAALEAKQFDKAIGLLEEGMLDGRNKVRRLLAEILTPSVTTRNATATHEALLTLSRNHDGRTRLVTTNFDRLFEKAIADKGLVDLSRYQAPLLPVPKQRWDGLVYLHGRLPDTPADKDLDDLVISSGDFGRAYLTERWAARFVGELFRNYTVCFVGYSINDAVMHYMTDALAADRLLGESPFEMFAFGSYSKDKESKYANEWKAKNVTPILYRDDNKHESLYQTLHEWAETYCVGASGKESIVARCAGLRPTTSTEQDDFVGRVLWALGDSSGLPAKRFADLDPVSSLDWLEPFSANLYRQTDLSRFGVQPDSAKDDSLQFSLICRPSPYTRAPWMTLVDRSAAGSKLDQVMRHAARWLTRHLDDPKLVLWLTRRGTRIHPEFAEHVDLRLQELDELERSGKTDELRRIRNNAPRAIPRPMMRVLWRVLLAGQVTGAVPAFNLDWLTWRRRFERDGLTLASRFELRDMLTPRVSVLGEPIPWDLGQKASDEARRIADLVDWKIVLSIDDVHYALENLQQSPRWPEALPVVLDDFSALLRDAMDLARELGGVDNQHDRSYIYLPSIAQDLPNIRWRGWASLIRLTRDAWTAAAGISPERARRAAENWCTVPYPVFRRLALFAATHQDVIPPRQRVDWLLADDHWWLWSVETQNEAIRLLAALVHGLDTESLARLERAVLAGPPRSMYQDGIEPERLAQLVEREVWLRLAKLDAAGAALGTDAQTTLAESSLRHPKWKLAADERDEFSFWIGAGDEFQTFVATPRRRRELVGWLQQNPKRDDWRNDDWSDRCRDNFPVTACALYALARDSIWPTDRWREALHVWSEGHLIKRSWRYMAPVLAEAPDDELQSLTHALGWWLKQIATTLDPDDTLFPRLCQAVLALDYHDDADEDADDLTMRAINHPLGRVTEGLLSWWTCRSLQDGQGLPDTLRRIFTMLCDVQVGTFRYGRSLLASRVVTLFRVDDQWTTQHLLPLFDWHSSQIEARAAWSGFLWSPRLHRPLMESIKDPFLDTANHYRKLGDEEGAQYVALLTSAALDRVDTFTQHELATATEALPENGLRDAAEVLVDRLEAAGKQREEYWRSRVRPYLRKIWPRGHTRKTPVISECLGRLCIAGDDVFPNALEELRPWLGPLPDRGYLMMHRLNTSRLCEKFPRPSLAFLSLVTGNESLGEVEECLTQIRSTEPQVENDPQFRRLHDLLRAEG